MACYPSDEAMTTSFLFFFVLVFQFFFLAIELSNFLPKKTPKRPKIMKLKNGFVIRKVYFYAKVTFLIVHLNLSGMWLVVTPTMDTKKICVKENGLDVQTIIAIQGSVVNITGGGVYDH